MKRTLQRGIRRWPYWARRRESLARGNPYTLDDVEALYKRATGRNIAKDDLVKVGIRIDTKAERVSKRYGH